jgi:hypothetical protein
MKARSLFIASASALLAGSAMLVVSPAAPAFAKDACHFVNTTHTVVCTYSFGGTGATPAAAEADAAAQDPGCGNAKLVTGPAQLPNGQWYVVYTEICANGD